MQILKFAKMYYVKQENGQRTWIVKIAAAMDYKPEFVEWMDDPLMSNYNDLTQTGTLVPDIDLCESSHMFQSEFEAMKFMAEHYARQLKN